MQVDGIVYKYYSRRAVWRVPVIPSNGVNFIYLSGAYPADGRAEWQDEKQQTKHAQNETDVIRRHVTC
jgi:hypothetical protein